MRTKIRFVFFVLFLLSVSLVFEHTKAFGFETEPEKMDRENICADSEFGIQFYCEADWKWKRVDDAILIIVSEDPTVTLTISKVNTPITFLTQLTKDILRDTGLYEEGFRTEYTTLDNKQALNIKAFSAYDPNIRLNDYYIMHHNSLYGILFSVNPKESWAQEQFNIKKIKDSFQFFE